MSVKCNKTDCERTWDRDPVLEVACPSCSAVVGVKCRRPSGWTGNFVGSHKARDLLALEEGYYGECPSGRCPETPAEHEAMGKEEPAPDGQATLEEAGL